MDWQIQWIQQWNTMIDVMGGDHSRGKSKIAMASKYGAKMNMVFTKQECKTKYSKEIGFSTYKICPLCMCLYHCLFVGHQSMLQEFITFSTMGPPMPRAFGTDETVEWMSHPLYIEP